MWRSRLVQLQRVSSRAKPRRRCGHPRIHWSRCRPSLSSQLRCCSPGKSTRRSRGRRHTPPAAGDGIGSGAGKVLRAALHACSHLPRPLPPLHVRNHPRRECGRRPSSHNRASARQGQRRACAAVQAPRLIVIVKLYKSLLIDYARKFDLTPGLLVWLTTMPCVQRKRLRATRSHRRPNASPALAAAAVRRARRRAAAAALLSVAPVQLALGRARSVRAARRHRSASSRHRLPLCSVRACPSPAAVAARASLPPPPCAGSAPASCGCVTQRCGHAKARPGPCLLRTCSEPAGYRYSCPKPAGGRALHATHAPVRRQDSMQWAMGDGRSAAGGADGGAMLVI